MNEVDEYIGSTAWRDADIANWQVRVNTFADKKTVDFRFTGRWPRRRAVVVAKELTTEDAIKAELKHARDWMND